MWDYHRLVISLGKEHSREVEILWIDLDHWVGNASLKQWDINTQVVGATTKGHLDLNWDLKWLIKSDYWTFGHLI